MFTEEVSLLSPGMRNRQPSIKLNISLVQQLIQEKQESQTEKNGCFSNEASFSYLYFILNTWKQHWPQKSELQKLYTVTLQFKKIHKTNIILKNGNQDKPTNYIWLSQQIRSYQRNETQIQNLISCHNAIQVSQYIFLWKMFLSSWFQSQITNFLRTKLIHFFS